jgi:hypothetical protein
MNSNVTLTRAEPATNRLGDASAGASPRTTDSLALADLRNRLLQEALTHAPGEPVARLVRLAAVEAEAQAWLISFPLLLFPALFEEKACDARSYVARQRRLRQ